MIEFSMKLEELKKAVEQLEIAEANGFNNSYAAFHLISLGDDLSTTNASHVCTLPGVKKKVYSNRWSRCGLEWISKHKFDNKSKNVIEI